MAIVEVVAVERHEVDHGALVGAYLDGPVEGAENNVYALDLRGWAIGRTSPVATVEVWSPEIAPHWKVVAPEFRSLIPLTVYRPDVTVRHPVTAGVACGFSASLGVVGTAPEFDWLVQVVLEDERRFPLATIRVKRRPLLSGFAPALQPLLLTSLGRSGSSWVMRLFAEHPAIVVQRRLYDTRAAGYWMHMICILSRPAAPAQPMAPAPPVARGVRQNPFYGPPLTDDPDIRRWLGRGYPEQLAAFCQQAVEQLYLRIAESQQQSRPRYFAEKSHPDAAWLARDLYPGMREIFLVRDFRDLVSSILAFDARRGFHGFGRRPEDGDADYLRRFRVWVIDVCAAWRRRADHAHLLRYEDLVRDPVETVRRALEYLDLEATPSLVRRMVDVAGQDTATWSRHRTSPDALASIGRWRRDLPPATQELCQELFADALREFGYEREV